MQVQQLDTADETKVPMPRGSFAFAEVERSGDGDGEIRRTTSRLSSSKAHPGRVQKMEGSPRWGRSVCQSRVVVLLVAVAVATIGSVVRKELARACLRAVRVMPPEPNTTTQSYHPAHTIQAR